MQCVCVHSHHRNFNFWIVWKRFQQWQIFRFIEKVTWNLSVYCWNGHQLLVRLLRFLHPLCLFRFPRHLPLAFQQDPFGFSQKEKALSQNPLGKSQKELAEKQKEEKKKEEKKEEKKEQDAGEQSSKDLISNKHEEK